ncbi:MAG: hypothetical protein C3F02_02640 [Parcubacteria group bacterium]|nr:MAG: hypothetical protein C3F02_02640 [Parcubacteria group bacterium]
MATAAENLAVEKGYWRELNQSRRLPRLVTPEAESQPADDQTEDDYIQEDDVADEDVGSEEQEEVAMTEQAEQEVEQVAEEEEEEEEIEDLEAQEEQQTEKGGGQAGKEAVDRLKKEAVKKSQEAVARLASRLKIAKIGSALTLVGIIVTYLIMTFQFIAGNWLAKANVPKLSLGEIIIWGLLSIIILLAILLLFLLFFLVILIAMGPTITLGIFGQQLLDIIF